MLTLPYVGLDEINNARIGTLKALFAEFLGTGLLVNIWIKSRQNSVYSNKIELSYSFIFFTLKTGFIVVQIVFSSHPIKHDEMKNRRPCMLFISKTKLLFGCYFRKEIYDQLKVSINIFLNSSSDPHHVSLFLCLRLTLMC